MIAYKLFRARKDGSLGSLFINRKARLPVGEKLMAEGFTTKGFAYRPFWHVMAKPEAPHLSTKGRRWYKVEIGGYMVMERPVSQGGTWYLANHITILEAV